MTNHISSEEEWDAYVAGQEYAAEEMYRAEHPDDDLHGVPVRPVPLTVATMDEARGYSLMDDMDANPDRYIWAAEAAQWQHEEECEQRNIEMENSRRFSDDYQLTAKEAYTIAYRLNRIGAWDALNRMARIYYDYITLAQRSNADRYSSFRGAPPPHMQSVHLRGLPFLLRKELDVVMQLKRDNCWQPSNFKGTSGE